jgi:hypothetical protein
MDFTNRGPQPQPAGTAPSQTTKVKRSRNNNKLARIATFLIGAVVIILLIALVVLISFGGPKSEDKYVDSSKLQAVFLNTGQVYFGNIKSLNNKYYVLTNIYYLQSTSSSSSATTSTSASNITLVKLGCELHQPYDQMVINSDQVTFWENLQSTGQVAKAVATFQQQNPNGQKCSDQSSSASTNSSSATQNAGTSSTPTTGSSTTSGQ